MMILLDFLFFSTKPRKCRVMMPAEIPTLYNK